MTTSTTTVSVIVRSMARATLGTALASIAAQDYPSVEVLLVNASGDTHPSVGPSCGTHRMRLVESGVRLSRPQASNVGLDNASGDWITFLDDDDLWMPDHISGLMSAREAASEARVAYSYARAVFKDGRVERFGQPFSIGQLYDRNFISLCTAVVARSLCDDGCRFDDALDIHEDWDFLLQCAQHTPFHFVPRVTFQWNVDAGTSGAGGGTNQDDQRFAEFRDRIYAKWAAPRDALIDKVNALLQSALACVRNQQFANAEILCDEALAASQNDPWALNLLAMIQRSTHRLAEARASMELATAVRPQDPALAFNLALLCRAMGDTAAAVRHCRSALGQEPGYAPATQLIETLAGPDLRAR
jgi:hypothetical protein